MALSNKIFTTLFHPAYDTAAILRETSRWQEQLAPKTIADDHRNDRSIDRRLRIGYVSPHLRDHVVGRNIAPLFQHRDRGQFEVFCYSSGCPPDRFNRKFRELADEWREIGTSTDDDAAAQIRQDEIDILVDTSLHLAGNRLPIFARKPAPVQVTCFGYPGTTGLKAIDYRLTDPYLDPFGACDDAYTEASIRLAHSFWCYDPQAMDVANCPEPGPLPALAAGRITFGCLNNFRKINDAVVQLWARVLGRVPSSRILALAPRGRHRARLAKRFGELGVAAERVDFIDRESHKRYLESYRRLDIALDTFPYNGHTTSLDAYWMGVPVVTRIGATVVARAGYSQTCNLGLSELAAETDDQFVAIASSLAADLPRLSEIRSSLRSRMRASPLCDAAEWTRGIESAYREIWKDWCVRKGGK
jgi:predicted O-linked N-acetylglucosamine transferase (SPINDLY family)